MSVNAHLLHVQRATGRMTVSLMAWADRVARESGADEAAITTSVLELPVAASNLRRPINTCPSAKNKPR